MNKLRQYISSNKTLKNFMVYGIGQGVNLISPLLITPYLIYICGLEKLGIVAIGQSVAYILIVFVDYSSYILGVKEISVNRENQRILERLFSTIYAAKFFLLLIVLLLTLILVTFIPYFNDYRMTIFYSLSIVIGQFINPTWFFQGTENFKWITIINILAKVLYVGGVLLFVTSKSDFLYANLWLGLGAIIANLIGFLWIIKQYNFNVRHFSYFAVQELLVKDFSFCVSQLFFAIRNYSTILIVAFFAGDFIAGQFKVVEQIINLLRTYLQMFFKFSYSYVCFEVDRNLKQGLILWRKFNLLNFGFLVLLLLGIYTMADYVLQFFRVEAALFGVLKTYLRIALFVPLLIGITLPLEQLIFSLNKNKAYIRLTMASTLFNIIFLSVIMKFFALEEAFILLIFTEAMLIVSYYLLLKPYFEKMPIASTDQ